MSVSNNFSSSFETICAGIDCEWSIHDGTQAITRLLQVSFPNEKAAVVNLSLIKAFDEATFPRSLKLLLENVNVSFFGRKIDGDLKRLKRLGVNIVNFE